MTDAGPRTRRLDRHLTAWRIGDPEGTHPIWHPGSALLASGRWHEAVSAVIYASENYSTAMLEKLVHHEGEMPPNQHVIDISIPAGLSYEVVTTDTLDGWAARDGAVAHAFGRVWYTGPCSAIQIVPSVVARMGRNLHFNALHPDLPRISAGLEEPISWDERLFES